MLRLCRSLLRYVDGAERLIMSLVTRVPLKKSAVCTRNLYYCTSVVQICFKFEVCRLVSVTFSFFFS